MEYSDVVFTPPAEIAYIAYWNEKAVSGLLLTAPAETVVIFAADPKRPGARIGTTSVLLTPGRGDNPPSQCGCDRLWRLALTGWIPMRHLPAWVLPARSGAVATLPPPFCRRIGDPRSHGPTSPLPKFRRTG